MKKTILLGSKEPVSIKTSKWFFLIIGIFYIITAFIGFLEKGYSFQFLSNSILGFLFLFYSIVVFTLNPFAPKVVLTNEVLKLKKKVFQRTLTINWSDVKSIEFDSYTITFYQKVNTEVFVYETNAETSIEIKTAIRELAKSKNIEVTGG